MGFYEQGLAIGKETPVRIVGEEKSSSSKGSKGLIGSLIAIGGIGFALWWFLREKPAKQEGPDTSDIEEMIRARGLDPHKYGFGRG